MKPAQLFNRLALVATLGVSLTALPAQADITLLNVSYDPTRELYQNYNAAFAKYWQAKTGEKVTVRQSHGGSGRQARSVIDGLEADVVTLALAYDIDEIAAVSKQLPGQLADTAAAQQRAVHVDDRVPRAPWQSQGHQGLGRPREAGHRGHHAESEDVGRRALELPRRLGLRAEEDRQRSRREGLRREALQQRPCTRLGGARIDDDLCRARHRRRLPVVGERGVPGHQGTGSRQARDRRAEPVSILAEPPVTVVDKVVDKRGTRKVAEAYLQFWYTPEGQEIAARNYYRPTDAAVAKKYEKQFAKATLFNLKDYFGDWQKAQKTHFADGGTFDQIYKPGSKF